jgi:hypothetical protein
MSLRKIIKETIDDFDWVKGSFDKLHPGTKYKTPNGNIVTIRNIIGDQVWWSVYDILDKQISFNQHGHVDVVREWIDKGSWVLHSLPNE